MLSVRANDPVVEAEGQIRQANLGLGVETDVAQANVGETGVEQKQLLAIPEENGCLGHRWCSNENKPL